MNRDRFLALEAEIKGIIRESFAKAFKKSSSDFVLLMARGGYHKHLDRPDSDLTPFVLEDKEDFLMDLTRKKFFEGSGDGSLIRSIGIMKPSPNPALLDPSVLVFAA